MELSDQERCNIMDLEDMYRDIEIYCTHCKIETGCYKKLVYFERSEGYHQLKMYMTCKCRKCFSDKSSYIDSMFIRLFDIDFELLS